MLPDTALQLLTAAVDGELAPRQERQLRRLLAASDEAREVYARLRADSRRLRGLPKAAPPADLKERIVARLLEVTPLAEPAVRPLIVRPVRTAARRPWVPVAVAASLLLGISGGTFLIVSKGGRQPGQPGGNGLVFNKPQTPAPAATRHVLPPDNGNLPSTPTPVEVEPRTGTNVAEAPPPAPEREPETAPVPSPRPVPEPPKEDRSFAARPEPETPKLDLARVRVPFLVPVAELGREDTRQRLADELGRAAEARVDLFVKDAARGVEQFQAAAKAAGLHVHADAAGTALVKRKDVKAVLVYTDALTPAELRDLLARFAPDAAFDSLHVTPIDRADHAELQKVLGTDPLPKRVPGDAPKGGNVSANTADQIARTVGTPAPAAGKHAVLMPYHPPQLRVSPAMSRELKQFLDRRGDRKPGAVPVMIVLRQA